jgi:hypothetical protein
MSLGENSSKIIAAKYRYLHPSMVGKTCINSSSNSDIGVDMTLNTTNIYLMS